MRIFKKALTCLGFLSAATLSATTLAQDNSEWFLHSAISPDGKQVLFSHKGDIFTVSSKGGIARPLTVHSAWDGHPVWSDDGKHIAFASDRNGNLDVYLMPAVGGKATQLTYHSADDIPKDFTAGDEGVYFVSARLDSAEASIFPTRRLTETYQVSVAGGTPSMVSTIPGSELSLSPNGKHILYRDEKAYENQFRKRDVSAFARDIWLMDLESGEYRQLTTFEGGDHNPVWSDNDTFYYTSEEKSGVFNVWRSDLDGDNKRQITDFDLHPVRSLSISDDGDLAFVHHGSIYVKDGRTPKKLKVTIAADSQENAIDLTRLSGRISEFAVSPDGKEVAFIARGEVFVASTEFNTTRAITNTPQQERSVSFHKDGRTLLYAAERDGRWGLYETSIADEDEPYFFAATKLQEEVLHLADSDSFQPQYSPDGTKVAFLAGRDEIQVINRETKEVNVALPKDQNYSYADGDISFSWAPDSYWMTADFAPRNRLFITNVGIFPADGSAAPVDISLSGYYDGGPIWHNKANAVLWSSTRYGQRDHGSWGRESDVMAAFLTQDSYDKFRMSKEEYALHKELEKKREEDKEKDKDDAKDEPETESKDPDSTGSGANGSEAEGSGNGEDKKEETKPLEIDWDDIEMRTVRLTMHASDLAGAAMTSDGSTLYYLSRFEKGYDLWAHKIRERSTKLVAKLNASSVSLYLSPDDKKIYVLADGTIRSGKVGDKISLKPISAKPVMQLQAAQEREFMFNHSWRVIKDKFYRDDFHGVDWDAMGEAYRVKLPSIGHNRDLANMFAEMTGELNASHIGSSYRPRPKPTDTVTGALGLFFDTSDTSGALSIVEVLDKGPLDKANIDVVAGDKLTAVDGVALGAGQNLYALLNHKAGKRVRLSFENAEGESFDEVVKPISLRQQGELLYKRWVNGREQLVEELSGGRLAYVHVRGMNDPSFRDVYSRLLGKHFDKEAVVVDTRWNGGGWLHNDLAKLLTGEEYFTMHVRGRQYHGDPLDQWNKPSVLVMNEGNYSDAHAFAYTYDQLDIGEMVGMPVPGTMTAVWWETGISGDFRAGVPQVGMKNTKGEYLENNQTMPDHMVNNDPASVVAGQDKQIEKAVQVLLQSLDNNSN